MTDYEGQVWRAIGIAAEQHGIPPADIHNKRNLSPCYVDARRTAFFEAQQMGVPGVEIARVFGLDSSTVYYHLRAEGVKPRLKDFNRGPRPAEPLPPVLPANKSDWSEIDWFKAMAHQENQAMRAR